MEDSRKQTSRRAFLTRTAAAGGGLAVGSRISGISRAERSRTALQIPVRHYQIAQMYGPGIHPELPYFSFALVRKAPYTMFGSQPLELRHRFFVHSGRPDSLRAERLAADFADPPIARPIAGPSDAFEEDL